MYRLSAMYMDGYGSIAGKLSGPWALSTIAFAVICLSLMLELRLELAVTTTGDGILGL